MPHTVPLYYFLCLCVRDDELLRITTPNVTLELCGTLRSKLLTNLFFFYPYFFLVISARRSHSPDYWILYRMRLWPNLEMRCRVFKVSFVKHLSHVPGKRTCKRNGIGGRALYWIVLSNYVELIPRPARSCDDPPLYLRLRTGRPKDKKIPRSTPIMSYGKKKLRPEYWFSVPRDRWVQTNFFSSYLFIEFNT